MPKIGLKSLLFGRPDASNQAWWRPDALKALVPLEAAAKPLASECQSFVADVRILQAKSSTL